MSGNLDWQYLFNIVVGVSGAGLGWWLNTVWNAVSDLQRQDRELAEKVGRVEILVAGDYVKKDEFVRRFESMEDRIFLKLESIESKLNGKADKS